MKLKNTRQTKENIVKYDKNKNSANSKLGGGLDEITTYFFQNGRKHSMEFS